MTKLGFIVIFICVTISAWAHVDHLGELRAEVEECRDHFCIRFYNNQEVASSGRGLRHYLVEVGLDGAVLRKKHEEARRPNAARSLEKVVNGVRTRDRKQTFAVKPGQHAPGAKLFLYRLEKKKVVERIPLPLGKLSVEWIDSMVVRGKSVYLLLTEHDSDDLCLLYLEEGGRKLVKRLKLEDVYKIYLFPTASDLGFHGDAVFVAWINWGGTLTLTRFDPVSGERKDEVLHEEVTGNGQLSMKIINNTLLVAYQVLNKENSWSSVEWSLMKI